MNKLIKMATMVVGVGIMLGLTGCSQAPREEYIALEAKINELLTQIEASPFRTTEAMTKYIDTLKPEELVKELEDQRARYAAFKEYISLAVKANNLAKAKGGSSCVRGSEAYAFSSRPESRQEMMEELKKLINALEGK